MIITLYPSSKELKNLFTLLLSLLFFPLYAFHIIGGEITYVCKGSENYDFTFRMYRDCQGGGACFDSQKNCDNSVLGHLTIFRGTSVYTTIVLEEPLITQIEPNVSNPCLILPPNVCVEEGVYTFSVSLPLSASTYTIAYQRCCRNSTILNIATPDRVGATYTTIISPESQAICNSSPTFNDFPPIVICKGEDINFDHSATDLDGDSLVYSFCTPFVGGGFNTSDPFLPNGITPDPETPPPYESVRYIEPYSATNPLNRTVITGQPRMKINRHTGLITGIPQVLGQFVVGVCVRAYSNGVFMNEVRRDFQFNVANCKPTVVADVEETELRMRNNKPLYYIKLCGDEVIKNESTIRPNILSQEWIFDIPNGVTNSNLWNPEDLKFPEPGIYDGQLILNPNQRCNDTAQIQVELFPDIESEFTFSYDTCMVGPINLTDLSYTEAGSNALVDWHWNFDNKDSIFYNSNTHQSNFTYFYEKAGAYDVELTVRDINNCVETSTQTISYFPLPPVLATAPSHFEGCLPANITFQNLSAPINHSYEIIWDFGDGNSKEGLSPTHLYETAGIFDIGLSITTPFGCQIDTLWPDLIETVSSPIADFTFNPEEPSNFEPLVQFTDQSIDAIRWEWNFNNQGYSFIQNPSFEFHEKGTKFVSQKVWHPNGCIDSTQALINVVPKIRYQLPNAFSPNGDGLNDEFMGAGNVEDALEFTMSVWNRYGEKLFETKNHEVGWNGRKNNTGDYVINGVYVVLVQYTNPENEVIKLNGFVTVLK